MAHRLLLKMSNPGGVRPENAPVHERRYRLHAVTGEGNKPWSKFTPFGVLEFTVTNPDAPELEPGEYIITIEAAATAEG